MAEGGIPVSLCYQEQGGRECHGCTATSRRCVECGQTNALAEPREGICAKCLVRLGTKPSDASPRLPGGSTSRAFERAVEAMECETDLDLEALGAKLGKPQEISAETELSPSRLVANPESVMPVLLEHLTERPDGLKVVTAPARVLSERARLLPHEAKLVLGALTERGFVKPLAEGWSEVEVLKTNTPVQTGSPVSAVEDKETRSALVTDPRRVLRTNTRPGSVENRIPTIAEVFAELQARYREISGERLVHGAVPMLQLRCRIGAPIVIRMLERLEAENLIEKRDGWRTVVLLADEVGDMRPALGDEVLARLRLSAARAKIRLRRGVGVRQMLEAAMTALEQSIGELRGVAEGVTSQIESLEGHLAELRMRYRALTEAMETAEQAVEISERATEAVEPSSS